MDYFLFREVNGLAGWPVADAVFRAIANGLPVVVVAVVAGVFLWPWRQWRAARRRGAVFATASAAVALFVNQPIAHLVDRLRPFVAHPHHAHLLIARSHDPSFPSDHATGAFALAMGMWCYDRRIARVLFALAGVMAFSRVYVGTHYPGDVVGGGVIGAGVALVLWRSPLRSLIERASEMFSDGWEWIRRGAARLERRYPASVMLTGSGIALLAASALADRVEHGLSALMTFIVVDAVLWLLALGWVGARRFGPRITGARRIGWLRDWMLPALLVACAAVILFLVISEHLTVGAGPDAWLAMTGAALVLIAQIIGQATPDRNGN